MPAGEQARTGRRGRHRTGKGLKAPITNSSAAPPAPLSAQPQGRAEQELAEVCQAPAEVSGKL